MSRLSTRVLLTFASLAAAASLRAQEPAAATAAVTPTPDVTAAPTTPVLTLEECIARALEKNFSLKIQGYNTSIAKETINIAKANFEPNFTASTARSMVQVAPTVYSDYTDTRVGVTQNLTTGAAVSVSSSLNRTGNTPVLALPNPAYNSDLSLAVVQPLLRGGGTAVNRAAIERSKLGLTIANLGYKSSVLQVIRDTEAAYYNLVFARGQLAVKQHSLELAQRLYDENKARRTTGVATDLDVLTAEVGVANARNGVVTAQQLVRNNEDSLLALIGQVQFNVAVGAVSLPDIQDVAPSFDLSYKLAREQQPDLIATETTIKQFELDSDTAKNGALPTLNLGGAVGYNGTDRSYGTSLTRVTDGDARNWQVDLSLNVPWGLHADRARYRTALAGLRQEQARLQQIEQSLIVQVRSAVLSVETNRESVEIFGKSTTLAEKQYELQLARFKAGLATSRQVLETQDDLELTRVAELQAKVNLRTAISNLHQLESSSLDFYHIALAQ
ncbi:MAG: outer rane efflux protein [Verrucomicrobia bacterium]|nr:outer rane efflux protein [Verrucomicrobiota bacterium]